MNEGKVYFIILIIIIIVYHNLKSEKITYTKYNEIINDNVNTSHIKLKQEKILVFPFGPTPILRGLTNDFNVSNLNNEFGGSKPYSDIMIDNNNLIANQMNYKYYESYRKKPLTKKFN